MTDTAAWNEGRLLFDRGAFWDCHEALEPAWLDADGTERRFLAGVILLAAALHKARAMGSPRGGRRNYAKALRHLAVVPDRWAGVDVRELEARTHRALRDASYQPTIPRASRQDDSDGATPDGERPKDEQRDAQANDAEARDAETHDLHAPDVSASLRGRS